MPTRTARAGRARSERIAALQAQLDEIHAPQAHQLLDGRAVALLVMVVASPVLGRAVAGRVLRPLRTITARTRRISADNLHERLAVPGPADEVKDLADTIDGLLERLEGAFAAQRRFVANASHELRTPLATMRAVAGRGGGQAGARPGADASRWPIGCAPNSTRSTTCWTGLLVLARTQHGALPDPDRAARPPGCPRPWTTRSPASPPWT